MKERQRTRLNFSFSTLTLPSPIEGRGEYFYIYVKGLAEILMYLEIIILVMAAVGIMEGIRLSTSVLLFPDPVGPGWYLFFMSCLLFTCAMGLSVRALIRRRAGQRQASLSLHKGLAGRALLLLCVYGAAITYLGYGIACLIFFISILRLFGERSWIRCGLIGVAITGCFYLVFSYLANMPLPQGLAIN